jgi:antitoxin ParD1/3/4
MTMNVNLGDQLEELVRAKVASGEYNSASEVMRDGLRALLARDHAVEHWLRTEVAGAYDAIKADPKRGISADKVRARLAAQHRAAIAKA